ncbi:MFS general substrate transporter [Xylariomycetidae sp. FL2044]|nr:MFS general substrate transporter [Xylariomycetidae sp. FL2044]
MHSLPGFPPNNYSRRPSVSLYRYRSSLYIMADNIEAATRRSRDDMSAKPDALKGQPADEGYELFEESMEFTYTEAESKAVAKKLDRHLLPLMCFLYGICYIDKACLSWAVLFGFREDLGLVGDQYSWGSSIFYFGYLIAQYPFNYFLQKYYTGRILGFAVSSWGILMIAHLGLRNFAGLMVVRFLLGICETCVMPAFILYTSVWYTRKEQVWRTLVWSSMQGIFNLLGALLSYGLGHITNTALKPWMYIFLVLGLLSLANGLLWLWLMPETPNKASFLNDKEKRIAVQRVAQNMTGIKGYEWKSYQLWHALKDPKVWLLMAYEFFKSVPNGGLTNFGTLVVKGFGFNSFHTLLIGLPSSFVSAGSMLIWGFFSIRYGNLRTWGMIVPLLIAIAGVAAVYATQDTRANPYGRVVAYWLINSYAVTTPFSLAIVGQNIAGHTKRAVTNTLLFILFAAGNIAGPFFFRDEDAPRYVLAITSILVFFVITLLSAIGLRIVMILENRRRDHKYGKVEAVEQKVEGMRLGMHDKTDNENIEFRYVL